MCSKTLKISTSYEVSSYHLYRYFFKFLFCFAVNSTIHKATDWFSCKENKFILAHDSGSEQPRGHMRSCFYWQSSGMVESIPCRRQRPLLCVCLHTAKPPLKEAPFFSGLLITSQTCPLNISSQNSRFHW